MITSASIFPTQYINKMKAMFYFMTIDYPKIIWDCGLVLWSQAVTNDYSLLLKFSLFYIFMYYIYGAYYYIICNIADPFQQKDRRLDCRKILRLITVRKNKPSILLVTIQLLCSMRKHFYDQNSFTSVLNCSLIRKFY